MVINHFRVTKQADKDKASFHFTGQRARLIGKETQNGRARQSAPSEQSSYPPSAHNLPAPMGRHRFYRQPVCEWTIKQVARQLKVCRHAAVYRLVSRVTLLEDPAFPLWPTVCRLPIKTLGKSNCHLFGQLAPDAIIQLMRPCRGTGTSVPRVGNVKTTAFVEKRKARN